MDEYGSLRDLAGRSPLSPVSSSCDAEPCGDAAIVRDRNFERRTGPAPNMTFHSEVRALEEHAMDDVKTSPTMGEFRETLSTTWTCRDRGHQRQGDHLRRARDRAVSPPIEVRDLSLEEGNDFA